MKEKYDPQKYLTDRGFLTRQKYNCPVALCEVMTDVSEYIFHLLFKV